MHRLAAVPGSTSPQEGPVFVEQPGAPIVLLSSADSDLAGLASLLADSASSLRRVRMQTASSKTSASRSFRSQVRPPLVGH